MKLRDSDRAYEEFYPISGLYTKKKEQQLQS